MDLRLTFNDDPVSYDKFRPTYPLELNNCVIEFSNLRKGSNALEIGIGAGQATLPFLKSKCRVKAIELGDELAKFVAKKFNEYDNFKVVNQDFDLVELEKDYYDLVYSASAFHWIPVETGLPKVMECLKPGGAFAWFSVQPMPADEHYEIHLEIQKVYREYHKYFGKKVALDPEEMKDMMIVRQEKRESILRAYGFSKIQSSLYYGERTFSAKDYIKLISTYSDHKAIPIEDRRRFLKSIEKVINDHGGYFKLSDTYILCMGRK